MDFEGRMNQQDETRTLFFCASGACPGPVSPLPQSVCEGVLCFMHWLLLPEINLSDSLDMGSLYATIDQCLITWFPKRSFFFSMKDLVILGIKPRNTPLANCVPEAIEAIEWNIHSILGFQNGRL